jgi:hypothetical protein
MQLSSLFAPPEGCTAVVIFVLTFVDVVRALKFPAALSLEAVFGQRGQENLSLPREVTPHKKVSAKTNYAGGP